MNILNLIKEIPIGTRLYSPICGECFLLDVEEKDNSIWVTHDHDSCTDYVFDEFGRSYGSNQGECLLFPSEELRDWKKFGEQKCQFKPFDKVVVSDGERTIWQIDLYASYKPGESQPYRGLHSTWKYCLPYNEETAKLIGETWKKEDIENTK